MSRAGAPAGSGAAAASRPGRVVRFAPAKLNLTLAVMGRREDGFHALHSVMVPLALGDTVALGPARGGRTDSLRISGLPLSAASDNLVLRAVAATRAAVALDPAPASTLPPLAARLTKRIPVAAGLGGGSSDAASAVAAALEVWEIDPSPARLLAVAASLGSDVPFFLAGGAALVTGRGEFVEPLPDVEGGAPAVLLVTPRLAVSTATAFAAYAAGARPTTSAATAASERLAARLRAGLTAAALIAASAELAAANDLLPATLAVAPPLAGFRAALGGVLGRPVGQSGSGPTAWALYPSLAAARSASRLVRLAVLDGTIPRIGDGEPFVAVTTILASGHHIAPAVHHNGGHANPRRER